MKLRGYHAMRKEILKAQIRIFLIRAKETLQEMIPADLVCLVKGHVPTIKRKHAIVQGEAHKLSRCKRCKEPIITPASGGKWYTVEIMAVIILLTITSCSMSSHQSDAYVCDCSQIKEVQSFVKSTIAAANNHSDEEMEDVIIELRHTAIKLYCRRSPVWFHHQTTNVDWSLEKRDSCRIIQVF